METDLMMLLDTTSRNMLSILSVISETDEWYTIHEISERLNVVERTIQRYILQLKDSIEAFNDEEDESDRLFLHYEKYKGVYLETPKGQGLSRFKQLILEQDETFVMLLKIIFEDFQSVTKYALDHYISESKVRKSIKKIRQYLKRYHLTLSNINFKIVGEEKQIRLLTFYLMWYGCRGNAWPFKQVDQEKIFGIVDSLDKSLNMKLIETQKKQLAYMLAVNLCRFRKNHIVSFEKNWENYVDIQEMVEQAPLLQIIFFKKQEKIISEIYFYLLLIQMKLSVFSSEELRERMIGHHQVRQSDVYVVTRHFVESFQQSLIPIPKELYTPFFVTSFCSHLFCKLFKYTDFMVDTQQSVIKNQEKYAVLYEQIHQLVDDLYIRTQNNLFLQKCFLVQKYTLLFSMIAPLTYFEPSIGIMLESDLPYLTKEALQRELSNRYSGQYHLVFQDYYDELTVDLILTNVNNALLKQCYKNTSIHYCDFPLNNRDIYELDNKMMQLYKEKYLLSEN